MITTQNTSDSPLRAVDEHMQNNAAAAPVGFITLLRTRSEWRVAVLMAIIAAAIYQVFVAGILNSFIIDRATGTTTPIVAGLVTAFLVFACSACAALYYPRGTWRWGLTVALAPSIVVVGRIVFDSIFVSPHLHSLFPFEVVMVFILTVPEAFIGATIGSIIGKSMKRLEA